MRILLIVFLGFSCSGMLGQIPGTITTIAGNGLASFSGDGGSPASASFNRLVYIATDSSGALYVADEDNQRVRKISGGVIHTVAGNGTPGFSGDGGPAVQASLNHPTGVYVDASGNLYIAETANNRVRRVSPAGVITTFAGTGAQGSFGDGGPATAATFMIPIRISGDPAGNIYIADQGAHRVRKVTPGGIISTIAGNGSPGFTGDNGSATAASLDTPTALATDSKGNLYICDQFNQRIRKVDKSGNIFTIAGTGAAGFSGDGGPAVNAMLNFPGAIILDPSGNLYFTDGPNNRIRRIGASGNIATVGGNGTAGFSGDGGSPLSATFNGAFGIALDPQGNIDIADTLNNRIRQISHFAFGTPTFSSAGVVNAASDAAGLTPGGLATVFGAGLSNANGIVVTNQSPWPKDIAGARVLVNGNAAPLYAIVNVGGQEQINFQVPFEDSGSNATVAVDNNGIQSTAAQVSQASAQPGIYIIDSAGDGAFLHPNYQVVGAANPAAKGEVILMYLTGLGKVKPAAVTGAPATGLTTTNQNVIVTVDGQMSTVSYHGLAPTLIGLYQVNFEVPANAKSGSLDVIVTAGGFIGNTAKIAVK